MGKLFKYKNLNISGIEKEDRLEEIKKIIETIDQFHEKFLKCFEKMHIDEDVLILSSTKNITYLERVPGKIFRIQSESSNNKTIVSISTKTDNFYLKIIIEMEKEKIFAIATETLPF